MIEARSLIVRETPFTVTKPFLCQWHYLHCTPRTARLSLGIWHKEEHKESCRGGHTIVSEQLVGAILFGQPIARLEDQVHTMELTRMYLLDECGRNSESYCIGRAIRLLRTKFPEIHRLIAYSDLGAGHRGIVYAATGWTAVGQSKPGAKGWDNKWHRPIKNIEDPTAPVRVYSTAVKIKWEKLLIP